jgi:hypothetical protein
MKSLLFNSVLILISCAAAFAQTNEISPCPTIDVTGSPRIIQFGETATYTANLSEEAKKFNLQYQWAVSGGEIIEGQGTLVVRILRKPENAGESLTLTIEIIGLPEKCPNTSSESLACTLPPSLLTVDEFSASASQINKARLGNFAVELQNAPSAIGYITENFARKTSRKAIERKNQKIFDYLQTKGIEKDRIVIQNSFADKNLTQFILVPAGASPPSCDDCLIIRPN